MTVTREADSIRLANSQFELMVSAQFGPRITSFSKPGGHNTLAELGDTGIGLPDGRTVHRGPVFVKRAEHIDAGSFGDLDASGQCYCNADLVELETLGQVSALGPGASTTQVELWELHRIDPTMPLQYVPALLELDGGL